MDGNRINRVRQFASDLKAAAMESNEVLDLVYRAARTHPDKEGAKSSVRLFFRDVYNLLIGANQGPKIQTLIESMGRDKVIDLLDL